MTESHPNMKQYFLVCNRIELTKDWFHTHANALLGDTATRETEFALRMTQLDAIKRSIYTQQVKQPGHRQHSWRLTYLLEVLRSFLNDKQFGCYTDEANGPKRCSAADWAWLDRLIEVGNNCSEIDAILSLDSAVDKLELCPFHQFGLWSEPQTESLKELHQFGVNVSMAIHTAWKTKEIRLQGWTRVGQLVCVERSLTDLMRTLHTAEAEIQFHFRSPLTFNGLGIDSEGHSQGQVSGEITALELAASLGIPLDLSLPIQWGVLWGNAAGGILADPTETQTAADCYIMMLNHFNEAVQSFVGKLPEYRETLETVLNAHFTNPILE